MLYDQIGGSRSRGGRFDRSSHNTGAVPFDTMSKKWRIRGRPE